LTNDTGKSFLGDRSKGIDNRLGREARREANRETEKERGDVLVRGLFLGRENLVRQKNEDEGADDKAEGEVDEHTVGEAGIDITPRNAQDQLLERGDVRAAPNVKPEILVKRFPSASVGLRRERACIEARAPEQEELEPENGERVKQDRREEQIHE
jgi:hypothetical protein